MAASPGGADCSCGFGELLVRGHVAALARAGLSKASPFSKEKKVDTGGNRDRDKTQNVNLRVELKKKNHTGKDPEYRENWPSANCERYFERPQLLGRADS